jgi:hypothetical protein
MGVVGGCAVGVMWRTRVGLVVAAAVAGVAVGQTTIQPSVVSCSGHNECPDDAPFCHVSGECRCVQQRPLHNVDATLQASARDHRVCSNSAVLVMCHTHTHTYTHTHTHTMAAIFEQRRAHRNSPTVVLHHTLTHAHTHTLTALRADPALTLSRARLVSTGLVAVDVRLARFSRTARCAGHRMSSLDAPSRTYLQGKERRPCFVWSQAALLDESTCTSIRCLGHTHCCAFVRWRRALNDMSSLDCVSQGIGPTHCTDGGAQF